MSGLSSLLYPKPKATPVSVMGLTFPNPVGLAAGLDKNGDYIEALAAIGFGSVEIGTVTPRPQDGNPKPRLFRLPEAQAIINRMGFNNLGVEHLIEQVKVAQTDAIIGINIGKNFDTPVEKAVDDYLIGLNKVYAHADYVTINISSPNTPGLRTLQFGESLNELLSSLKEQQTKLHQHYNRYVPMAVKVAPDLTTEEVQQLAEAFAQFEIDGIIATNTTMSREGVEGLDHTDEAGGLSGQPVFEQSTKVVQQFRQALPEKTPIIAAGGILSGDDAVKKLDAGADLVQIYSGFIYKGPALVREIIKTIENRV
jgi:dihydroorotate dehydrogenase